MATTRDRDSGQRYPGIRLSRAGMEALDTLCGWYPELAKADLASAALLYAASQKPEKVLEMLGLLMKSKLKADN